MKVMDKVCLVHTENTMASICCKAKQGVIFSLKCLMLLLVGFLCDSVIIFDEPNNSLNPANDSSSQVCLCQPSRISILNESSTEPPPLLLIIDWCVWVGMGRKVSGYHPLGRLPSKYLYSCVNRCIFAELRPFHPRH